MSGNGEGETEADICRERQTDGDAQTLRHID